MEPIAVRCLCCVHSLPSNARHGNTVAQHSNLGLSDALLSLGLPSIGASQPLMKQLRVVYLWIAALLDSALPQPQTAAHFVKHDLIDGRYAFVTNGVKEFETDAIWLVINCPVGLESPASRRTRAQEVIPAERLTRALAIVAKMDAESRALLLGNYVEVVLNELIRGTPRLLPTVLQCFLDWLEPPHE